MQTINIEFPLESLRQIIREELNARESVYVSIADVMQMKEIKSRGTIYNRIHDKSITPIKKDGRTYFLRSEIDQLLIKLKKHPNPSKTGRNQSPSIRPNF
jgi:hypothetical protein